MGQISQQGSPESLSESLWTRFKQSGSVTRQVGIAVIGGIATAYALRRVM